MHRIYTHVIVNLLEHVQGGGKSTNKTELKI